jgi:hypothetical protein
MATVKDQANNSVPSSVTVTVNQTLTGIIVSPQVAAVPVLESSQFTATAVDQFGSALVTQPTITWSVNDGGTISTTGLFTAGSVLGNYTVTAKSGNITGTAAISVVNANQAPTIVNPAAANPNPVTGLTTAVSALGADDGGESNLTYTWSVAGAAPGTVTIIPNGANAAKNATADFSAAGTYNLLVTIADKSGKTVTSQVAVTAIQIPNLLTNGDFATGLQAPWFAVYTAPATGTYSFTNKEARVLITAKGTQNYFVQLYQTINVTAGTVYSYSFKARTLVAGQTRKITYMVETDVNPWDKDIQPEYQINDAWQTFSNTFTATKSRLVRIEIQAGLDAVNFAVDNFVVTPWNPDPAPTIVTAAAANPNPVAGITTALSVLAADNSGEAALTYSWSATGTPPAPVAFSANNTNASKNSTATFTKAGSYTLMATVRDPGNNTVPSIVTVQVNQTLSSIVVTPPSATVPVLGTLQFTATGMDQFGAALTTQPSFTWSAGDCGTISSNGFYTACGTPGNYTITVSSGDFTRAVPVTVIPVDNPPTIAVPAAANPNLVTGKNTNLSVLGADDGTEANLIYTWSVTGTPPAPVAFSANGTNAAKNCTATFTKAGSYPVQVTVKDLGGKTVVSAVTVTVSQTLTGISVTPANATVTVSETQQYTATGTDQFTNALTTQPTFTWSVSGGGAIAQNGLFTAGTVAGTYTVNAQSSGITGSTQVTVKENDNLLINGDFAANQQAPWIYKFTAPATGTISYGTGTTKCVINTKGTENYYVQFYQNIPVVAGKEYNYSFRARKLNAGGTRDISFVVESDATPWTKDVNVAKTITDTWQTFSGTFTPSFSRIVRIEIQAGLSDIDFEADDFVVTEK